MAIVLALLGGAAAITAFRMPPGTSGVPGPGAFPVGVAVALIGASVGLLAQALRARGDGSRLELGNGAILTTLAAMACVALALERVGFLGTFSLFLLVTLRAYRRRSWLSAAPAAVLGAALAYAFFAWVLGVRLPRGLV